MGLFFHHLGEIRQSPVPDCGGLAGFNAGRLSPIPNPCCTQVTMHRGKWQVIDPKPVSFRENFVQYDPTPTHRVTVLLFAGDHTGLASGAVFILYEQTFARHLNSFAHCFRTSRVRWADCLFGGLRDLDQHVRQRSAAEAGGVVVTHRNELIAVQIPDFVGVRGVITLFFR